MTAPRRSYLLRGHHHPADPPTERRFRQAENVSANINAEGKKPMLRTGAAILASLLLSVLLSVISALPAQAATVDENKW